MVMHPALITALKLVMTLLKVLLAGSGMLAFYQNKQRTWMAGFNEQWRLTWMLPP